MSTNDPAPAVGTSETASAGQRVYTRRDFRLYEQLICDGAPAQASGAPQGRRGNDDDVELTFAEWLREMA